MPRILLTLLLLLSFGYAIAQEEIDFDTINRNLQSVDLSSDALDSLNRVAFSYWSSRPDVTEKYGLFTLAGAERLNYQRGIANSNAILGISMWARDLYDEAISHYLIALPLYLELGEGRRAANVYMNIGSVYDDQQMFSEAKKYHHKAIGIFESADDTVGLARVYNNIGVAAKRMGEYDSSMHYYGLSLQKRYQLNDSVGIARVLNNMGVVKEAQEDYNASLDYALQALSINSQFNDLNLQCTIYENVGSNLIVMGQLGLAELYLDSALSLARDIDAQKTQILALEEFKNLEEIKGNYKEALAYMDQFVELSQMVFNEESKQRIDRLQMQYQSLLSEKKFAELEANETEARLTRNIVIVMLISALLMGLLVFNRQRLKIRKNKALLETQKQLGQIQVENAKYRENQLRQEIDQKQRELASYALNFVQKGQLMEELKDKIDDIKNSSDGAGAHELNKLKKVIDGSSLIDREWEDFKLRFEEVHHDFLQSLKTEFPDLSAADLKICALLKLNMNMKEAARVLGISPDSVKISRYRLRKKLGLATEDNLNDFIMNFGVTAN